MNLLQAVADQEGSKMFIGLRFNRLILTLNGKYYSLIEILLPFVLAKISIEKVFFFLIIVKLFSENDVYHLLLR